MIYKRDLLTTPSSCGIYIFYEGKTPIYIGKAINLKARLLSHLRCAQIDAKERLIIRSSDTIEIKKTLSEFEALLLEAALIKQFEPKYNRVWKDDKSYLYIKITKADSFPKVFLVRRESDRKSWYFGPFQSTKTARYLLFQIRRIIPFCTQKKVTHKRCFYAKIGLCDPCPNYIENMHKMGKEKEAADLHKKYKKNTTQVLMILKGQSEEVFKKLANDLVFLTKSEHYEEAMNTRDKLEHLKRLVYERSFESFDSLALQDRQAQVNNAIFEFLKKYFSIQKEKKEYRIECIDISNMFGKQATASLVVFKNGEPEKEEYRRFKIKSVHQIGDILMIQEVIFRRFKKREWHRPDMLIIDGGKPQLRAVERILSKNEIRLPLIGIAKNPDRIVVGKPLYKTLKIDQKDPFFTLVRAARDEAHRFAKKYHLLLRNKKILL